MPTPPRTYSPSAAETLRRSLLALAATAATATAADPVRPAPRLAGAPLPPPRADVRAADSVPQDSVSDAQELPAPADIARHEREAPRAGDGRTHAVSKSDGDEILALLKDWRTFEDLRPKPRKPGEPVICILPPPPDLVLSCLPQDGPVSKWRVIWEANKAAVPNPDYVLSGTSLVIPALPEPPEPRLGGRLVPAPAPTNSSRAESGSTEASGN